MFVGHDWGSMVVWQLALLHPERVAGVVGMSVPFLPRPPMPPDRSSCARSSATPSSTSSTSRSRAWPTPSSAPIPATTMRRMLAGATIGRARRRSIRRPSPTTAGASSTASPSRRRCPTGCAQAELDHYVAEFTRTGFTGGLNWYRNLDRNWELTAAARRTPRSTVPSLFIGGRLDPVLIMSPPEAMDGWLDDHRGTVLVDGAGHWVQQEKPAEVNAALMDFLAGLPL